MAVPCVMASISKNNGPEVIPAELWIDEIEAY